METQPLRSVSPSSSDKGGADSGAGGGGGGGSHKRPEKERVVIMEGNKDAVKEGLPSIKLGLGNGEQKRIIRLGRPVLTPPQLIEFQHQALIFKHMVERVPVPLHLVIPIWKNVAASFGSESGAIYRQYPSFVGFSPKEFKYRNMMDPEPGRCRRTDGKKWRCRKNVIPNQKYCERHMHRGRQQRSRKLVEASRHISAPKSTTNSENSKTSSNYHSQNSSCTLSPPPLSSIPPISSDKSKNVSTLFQLLTPSSSKTLRNDNITTSVTICSNSKNDKEKDATFLSISSGSTTVSTPSVTPTITGSNTNTNKNDVKHGENLSTLVLSISSGSTMFPTLSAAPTITGSNTNTHLNDVKGGENLSIPVLSISSGSTTVSIPSASPTIAGNNTNTCKSDVRRGENLSIPVLSINSGSTTVSTQSATPTITRSNTNTRKNGVKHGEHLSTLAKTSDGIFPSNMLRGSPMKCSVKSSCTGTPVNVTATATIIPNNKSIYSVGWKPDGGFSTINNFINRSSKISNNSNATNVSSGLGFSPKSVLQVVGCTSSCFYRNEMECEPWRCKRTDGKKWRCSRDILPDQKYCARHMHRGAKRRVEPSQPFSNLTGRNVSAFRPHSVTPSDEANSATPNTNLSISLPPSPQRPANDEKSATSYSSDATISDTTITAYENQ